MPDNVINKVVYDGRTLIDLTDTTATANSILSGYGAYGADGVWIDGTATAGSLSGHVWQDNEGYIHLDDEPGTEVVTASLSVTQNGTYTAPTGAAYTPVTVNVAASPTLQNKTVTPTTSSQNVTADSGYDGLGTVTVNAMPSGTAGTPTATKGAVSNHTVAVTPSVTNTTGYITGGTKTGTAVTVSASELVSGSQTITANDTYDVTNLASVIVNVSGGGGGFEYETGTFVPASDESLQKFIYFTNSHSSPPALVVVHDITGTYDSTTKVIQSIVYVDTYSLLGSLIPIDTSAAYNSYFRGQIREMYRSSATALAATSATLNHTGDANVNGTGYWASSTWFNVRGINGTYTLSQSRTYKWFALWGPIT